MHALWKISFSYQNSPPFLENKYIRQKKLNTYLSFCFAFKVSYIAFYHTFLLVKNLFIC